MIINITVPIKAGEHHLTDFEGAVEITVTHKGTGPSHDYPGDAAEWEVEEYLVDAGGFIKTANGKHVWRSNILPAPLSLRLIMQEYLVTTEGRDSIISSLKDEGLAV